MYLKSSCILDRCGGEKFFAPTPPKTLHNLIEQIPN